MACCGLLWLVVACLSVGLCACVFVFLLLVVALTRDAKAFTRSTTTTARTTLTWTLPPRQKQKDKLQWPAGHHPTPRQAAPDTPTRTWRALLALTGSSRGRRREACRLKLVQAVRGLVQDDRPDLRREITVLFSKSYSVATCDRPHSFISYRFDSPPPTSLTQPPDGGLSLHQATLYRSSSSVSASTRSRSTSRSKSASFVYFCVCVCMFVCWWLAESCQLLAVSCELFAVCC